MGKFFLKTFIGIFFLLILGFTAHAADLTVKQGEIFLYPISSRGSVAYFGGVKIPIFKYGSKKYALVAADVNKPLGNYYLRIKENTRSGEKEIKKRLVAVERGNYIEYQRGVAYKFNTLSPAKQQSVAKDKAPLAALLTKAVDGTTARIWKSIFKYPLPAATDITGPFGYKRIYTNYSTTHKGVDLKAKIGTPVYAASEGKVLWGEDKSLYLEGKMVALDHGDGIVTEYLHLSKVAVKTGSTVKAGDIIGYSGEDGADVSGPHLHFAVKVGAAYVNPLQFIEELEKLKK